MAKFLCSHTRAAVIYSEALASKCTLWGVKADTLYLRVRYGTQKLERYGDCCFQTLKIMV